MKFYNFNALSIDGKEILMSDYKNKVVLIVNTASKCGFTPQFEGLEKLYKQYKDRGFVILGFPCNQFGNQDPKEEGEIKSFCEMNYGVTFPMFSKVDVNGDTAHPIFKWLKSEKSGFIVDAIKWNFTKFLVNKNGEVVERYGSNKKPEDLSEDIEKLL